MTPRRIPGLRNAAEAIRILHIPGAAIIADAYRPVPPRTPSIIGWMRSLLSGGEAVEEAVADPIRAPRPLFAVGDVHGMSDLLDDMIERIAAQVRHGGMDDALVVFLGDYVDRGPDSRGALDLLVDAPRRLGVETAFLRGNHEEFMTDYLDRPYRESNWLKWGGDATVESYGLDPRDFDAGTASGQIALSRALAGAMDESHLSFLRETLVAGHAEWPFFFTHAGIDARQPPEAQPEQAMVHGAKGFRQTGGWPGSVVVHGHYITDEPDLGANRIGVDTGAYRSGVLTALHCIDDEMDFIVVEE